MQAAQNNSKHFRDQQRRKSGSRVKLHRLPIQMFAEEFQEFGGKAFCSNHSINFKIVECEADLITQDKQFFNPIFTH